MFSCTWRSRPNGKGGFLTRIVWSIELLVHSRDKHGRLNLVAERLHRARWRRQLHLELSVWRRISVLADANGRDSPGNIQDDRRLRRPLENPFHQWVGSGCSGSTYHGGGDPNVGSLPINGAARRPGDMGARRHAFQSQCERCPRQGVWHADGQMARGQPNFCGLRGTPIGDHNPSNRLDTRNGSVPVPIHERTRSDSKTNLP